MRRKGLFRLIAGAIGCLGVVFGGVASAAPSGQVVIAKGQPVQLAVAVDDSGLLAESGPSLRNAVRAAIERHPNVRGFPIQINALDATCGGGSGTALAQNATVANSVVANAQNVAVIGHACSLEAPAWLPVYESAGLVTINGSTTGTFVPALGPSVFNGTAVPEPSFAPWYAAVKALPADVRWSNFFQARFGSLPADFADLYFDATTVLVAALQMSARVENDNLVIDRAALATALRQTRGFPGVTCSITFDPLTGSRVNDPAALSRCASATSEIVFASDRANANPGEIFSLAAGRAPVDVSRSPATDLDAAIAPDGKRAAFWSNRAGGMRLYVSGLGGAGVRLVPQPRPGGSDQVMPLAFSPDGSRLLATTATGTSCSLFLVEVLSPRGLRVGNGCNAAWSSDGRSIAATAGRRVIVYDTTGHRRFSLRGFPGRVVSERSPGGRQRRRHEDDPARPAREGARPRARRSGRLVGHRQSSVALPPGRDPGRRLARVGAAAGARARPEDLVALRCRVHARRCTCPLPAPLRRRLPGDSRGGRHAAFAARVRRLVT